MGDQPFRLRHASFRHPGRCPVWLMVCIALGLMKVDVAAVFAETYDNQLPAVLSDLGVTERLADKLPLELGFRDEAGHEVRLGQYFHPGRPVILSFNYSSCPMLCNLQLSGLITGLKDVELTCGRDYEFVSVSIDPHESPVRAAQTRQRYYQMYGREGTGNGWHFLTASEQAITTLTTAVGVSYRYLPERKEYIHPAVCVSVTPDGRLSRYLYGVAFAPQTLRLGLVEASEGRIGTTLDQILLFCFHYDSETGRYGLAARRLMTAAGALTAIVLGGILLRQYRKESRLRRSLSGPMSDSAGLSMNQGISAITHQIVVVQSATEISKSHPH
jgi:protein SCO1/2